MLDDKYFINGLNQKLVSEIKQMTEKRLTLVEDQLKNIMQTAKNLEKRGYEYEVNERTKFLFELRQELLRKKVDLQQALKIKHMVHQDEVDFFLKVHEKNELPAT